MNGQPTTQPESGNPGGSCDACQQMLGAYVLQALDRFDQGMVDQHLRWCDDCRAELADLETVRTGLALAVDDAGSPSPGSWQAIAQRLEQDEDTESLPTLAATPAVPAPQAARHWSQWLPLSVIAPLIIVAIVLGSWGWSLQRDLDDTRAELANHTLLNSTLTGSQQVQLFSMEQSCPHCEGVGQVGVSQSNSMGMVVGWNFDPDVTHDVWGIDHNGDRSRVCSLIIATDGAVMQMFRFPNSPSTYTDIFVTDEAGHLVYTSHLSDPLPQTPPESPQA